MIDVAELEDEAILRLMPRDCLRPFFEDLVARWGRTDRLRRHVLYAQLYAPDLLWHAYPERADYTALIRAAGFQPPPDLPETVAIWRAGRAESVEWLRQGRSWTLDRATACIITQAPHARLWHGRLMLLRAEVPRAEILTQFCPVLREVVTVAAPDPVEIDGCPAEWQAIARAEGPALVRNLGTLLEAGTLDFPVTARAIWARGLEFLRNGEGMNRRGRRAAASAHRVRNRSGLRC